MEKVVYTYDVYLPYGHSKSFGDKDEAIAYAQNLTDKGNEGVRVIEVAQKGIYENGRVTDSRRIKDNTEECELWVQHDVYKEPVDPDFDWDAVDEDEVSPEDYTWGVNNQYCWEEPLYVDWNWSDDELVNYLIQIGFLNRGVTASDLNIDWDGGNDMIILEQASDGMPLGYITKAY